MWKLILVSCILIATAVQGQNTAPNAGVQTQYFAKIGEYITGRTNLANQGTTMHHYQLDEIEKKYLFFKLNSNQNLAYPVISIYDFNDRRLIETCALAQYSECYVQASKFSAKQKLVVLVSAKSEANYNLQTFWGDLEHIKPDSEITFMFGKNTSQLLHLQFGKQNFEQIRIIMQPLTEKVDFDVLKMFLKYGTQEEPTQKDYDLTSRRVWGGSEAIFLSKEQVKGKQGAFLYIVGNSQTIYSLKTEFIRQSHHDIELNEVLYQYLEGKQFYLYHIDSSKINPGFDEYAFKFSVFSGEIAVQAYTDKQMKNAYQRKPYQYMSDIGLFFTKDELFNRVKNLYVKVYCPDTSVIYQIALQARIKNMAYEVNEDIYQFLLLQNQKRAVFFKYPVFSRPDQQTPYENNTYIFTASIIKIYGSSKLQFYACNTDYTSWGKCINIQKEDTFSKSVDLLKPKSVSEIGSKTLYTLQVPEKYFKKTLKVAKEVMILAVFNNQSENQVGAVLEFSNPNKVKRIREDKATQEQILSRDYRVYKFENSDPTIQSVQIHYNLLSGKSMVKVTREDPRLNMAEIKKEVEATNQGNTVFEIKQSPNKPIYLLVMSLTNTIFVLTATVTHQTHSQSSALTIAEDIPYRLKIQAFSSKVIEIHPIQQRVTLKYKSLGGPIYICETNLYSGKCLPDSSSFVNSSTSGQMQIDSSSKNAIKFKIANSFNPLEQSNAAFNVSVDDQRPIQEQLPNTVEVQILYHSQFQNHCQEKKMGQIYSEVFKSGDCIKFHIAEFKDIEVLTHKQDIGSKFDMFFLCSMPYQPIYKNNKYFISQKQIQQQCKKQSNQAALIILFTDQTDPNKTIRYQYAAEYKNEAVSLKDGVSYTFNGISSSKQASVKTFYFPIIDIKKSTEIILFNHKGIQKFYGNVISNKTAVQTTANEVFSLIKSEDSNYFSNPEIELTPEKIKSAGCTKNCLLVVSVYSDEPVGTLIQFTMEITSSSVVLGEDQIHEDFLGEGSYQYYRYETRNKQNSLYIRVSDAGTHCTRIYLSEKEYPSPSNYLKKQINGELVLDNIKKQTYYIGVQAVDDCMYSISASQSEAKITKMQFGQFFDVKLGAGEKKFFLVKHISQNPFKILTLEKHGSLTIYANKTQVTKQLFEKLNKDQLDYKEFNFKSKYRNTLIVDNSQEGFCSDCFYLVVAVAQKITDSSLVLMGENAKLTLNRQKILFDEIRDKQTKTIVNFFQISDGQLMTKVHQGKIKIQMSYGQSKTQHIFEANKKIAYTDYDFDNNKPFSFQPIRLSISALQTPALYSLKMNPNMNQTKSIKMTPGEHSYVYLSDGKEQCISGYLRDKQQVIYLSVNSQDDLKLQKLQIKSKLRGQLTEKISKNVVGNIMEIKYKFDSVFFTSAIDYQICLSFNDTQTVLSIVALQNQRVNILPANTEVLIRQKNTYVLHPNGDLLLDVLSCEGQIDVRYGTTQEKIKQDMPHDFEKIGIPGQSHALKLEEYQTIFMQVKAKEATMTWMPMNEEKQLGMGYFKYSIGSLEYTTSFNKITFVIGGVTQIKQTNTTPVIIRYNIYVADSPQNLLKATSCEKFGSNVTKFIATYQKLSGISVNQTIRVPVTKKQITDTFHKNTTLYYNVVADMVLEVPNEEGKASIFQNYKFIYFGQQVPSEVFIQNILESSTNFTGVIMLVIVIIVGFLVVSFVFIKVIVPTIGKIRNRMFVEEQNEKDQSIPIPPSSERNQVKNDDNAPQTEEQMN